MPRTRGKELAPNLRMWIIVLRAQKKTYPEIYSITGVKPSVAYKTVARAAKICSLHSLPRSGRPQKFSARTQRRIIRTLRHYPLESYTSISTRLSDVTSRQVRYIANKNGFRRFVARRKPYVNKRQILLRLEWARTNRFARWDDGIWGDESTLKTGGQVNRPRVTRKKGEAYRPEHMVPTFRSGSEGLMVWGAVSHGYKTPLIRLEMEPVEVGKNGKKKGGGLSSKGYAQQVLEGPLKDFIEQMEKEKGLKMRVVEDGAAPHRGKAAQEARRRLGINQIPHPPNSPDLNPIEPIWRLLKNRTYAIPGSRKNLESLWEAALKAWDTITADEINAHTGKMRARVTAVFKSKGLPTKF